MRIRGIALPVLLLLLVLGTPAAFAAKKGPSAVTKDFYAWYLKNEGKARERFGEVKKYFEPRLYELLVEGFRKRPSDKGGWIDFDPFYDAQWSAKRVDVGKARITGSKATVPVKVHLSRSGVTTPTVELTESKGAWRISNVLYKENFDLRSFLEKILKDSR